MYVCTVSTTRKSGITITRIQVARLFTLHLYNIESPIATGRARWRVGYINGDDLTSRVVHHELEVVVVFPFRTAIVNTIWQVQWATAQWAGVGGDAYWVSTCAVQHLVR